MEARRPHSLCMIRRSGKTRRPFQGAGDRGQVSRVPSAIGDTEPYFQGHLVMADGAVLDVPAGIHHLEPFQMLDALRRFGEGVVDGVLDAGLGRADQFDLLVGVVIGHELSPRTMPGSSRPRLQRDG